MDAFFCCHGTMVQANAALNRLMYYQSNNDQIYITQYVNSEADFLISSQNIKIKICQDYMNGSLQNSSVNDAKQTINETTSAFANKPDFVKYKIFIQSKDNNQSFTINLRIPDWIKNRLVYMLIKTCIQKQIKQISF